MRVSLHDKATQKGLKVRTRKMAGRANKRGEHGEGLVFQFYDPSDELEPPRGLAQ